MTDCRVLVVDNDPFTLTSLANSLENNRITVAGRAGTAREALAIADAVSVDVALLDLDLGIGPNGIDLAHALRAKSPEIGLVLLSTYRDPRLMVPDVLSPPPGMAYLSKGEIDDFGQISRQILSVMASPLRQRTTNVSKLASLTASQLRILQLVA
jgi:DNA-binding NarL/FixJ family response regulator